MNIPILTPDIVTRLVTAENNMTLSRITGVQKLAGNPLSVDVRQFGHILATMMPKHPEPWWNRVGGIAPGDEGMIDEILEWYRRAHITCRFHIVPTLSSDELLMALSKHGYYQSGFRTALYGVPDSNQSPLPGIVVKEQKELKLFFDLAAQTHFIPHGDERFWKEVARAEFAGLRCYVAFVEGEPAAHAVMNVRDRVAVFGFGSTLERYRGRGCQGALLRARIADAAETGCDLVTVQTNPGSVSQRNVERAGLRVAFTTAIWTAA